MTALREPPGPGHAIRPILLAAAVIPLAWLAGGPGEARAMLPSLGKAPWIGFFAGHTGARGQFAIAQDGSMYYNHSTDVPGISSGHFHRLHPAVQVTRPGGETIIQRLLPDTLETSDQPTDRPGTITYRGKVRGGAAIEVVVEFARRDVSVGGRILDPGPGKDPQRFVLHVQAPPFYLMYKERETLRSGTPEAKAKLQKQIERQRATAAREVIVLGGVDGSRARVPLLETVDLSSSGLNDPGVASIDVDLDWLRGRKIGIAATGGSRMILSNQEPRPIFKHHYYITWMEDPASGDPGKGRMVFTTR